MDQDIKLLKQQVAAAEFLLRNLKIQLEDAEARAAAQRRQTRVDVPANSLGANGLQHQIPDRGGNLDQSISSPRGPSTHEDGTQFQVDDIADDDNAAFGDAYEDDAPGEILPQSSSSGYDLPSLELGTIYASLEDVKSAVVAHAISLGWTCGVNKRDRSRIVLKCRTGSNCPFHLRAEDHPQGARIVSFQGEHTCDFRPDQSHIQRPHVASLSFLRQEIPNFMNIDASTTTQEISDAIYQRFGTRVSSKQCRTLKIGPKRKRLNTTATCKKCGHPGHNQRTCGRVEEPGPMPPA